MLTDQEALKQYVEEKLQGDLHGRTVESQALELLKTYEANYKIMSQRADLATIATNIMYYVQWLDDQTPKALKLAKKVIELGSLKGREINHP
jgi:hypothetical protein